jgi:hypothetical protein
MKVDTKLTLEWEHEKIRLYCSPLRHRAFRESILNDVEDT